MLQENGIEIGDSYRRHGAHEQMKNFIEENNIACPTCGKHNFTDIRAVQPDVQDIPGCYRRC